MEIEPPLTLSLSWVDAEPVAAVDHLHGEGFVQFPQVDVVDLQSVAFEQLGHGKHRADAHFVRLAAGDGESRGRSACTGCPVRRRARATSAAWPRRRRTAATVAGRDRALAAVGIEVRLERQQSFERRVGAVALVAVDSRLLRCR